MSTKVKVELPQIKRLLLKLSAAMIAWFWRLLISGFVNGLRTITNSLQFATDSMLIIALLELFFLQTYAIFSIISVK